MQKELPSLEHRGDEHKPARPEPDNRDEDRDEQSSPPASVRAHPLVSGAIALLLVAAIAGGLIWWLNARHYELTNDAFIDARQFAIAPRVAGYVTVVKVTDNQFVKNGDLILLIDDADFRVALAQAWARLDQARAEKRNVEAQIAAQQSQVRMAELQQRQSASALKFAKEENDRAQTLVKRAITSVERAQQTQSQLEQAQAANDRSAAGVDLARKQLAAQIAQRQSALAAAAAAAAAVAQAKLNQSYTRVYADQAGHVVHLSAAKGEYVEVGQALSMFVPDRIWVTANFKETQITDMRPGQPVSIEVDAYPAREFHGRVVSIQPGSGTAFSLLPPENATGNYVKVVQRIPVKIAIDNPPQDVPLGPGMSVELEVKVR